MPLLSNRAPFPIPSPDACGGICRTWLLPALILAAILFTYRDGVTHDFAGYDNRYTISGNDRLNPPSWKNAFWFWGHADGHIYIPVTYSAWSLIACLAKTQGTGPHDGMRLDPAYFHGASILVHAMTTLAVFVILRLILRRKGLVAADWAAACGALLFGLHPMQVEAVGWASGLKDLLSGLFALLAIWQYLHFGFADIDPRSTQNRARWHYRAAIAFSLLALLAKPSAITLPALFFVLDVLVIRRSARHAFSAVGPLLALAIVFALMARLAQPARLPELSIWMRPLIAGDSLAFYCYKLLVPTNLGVDYARTPSAVRAGGYLAWSWAIPLFIAASLFLARRRVPWLAAAGLFFALAPLPTLGWMRFDYQRISTVADHYVYLAMLGPALILAVTLATLAAKLPRPHLQIALAAACTPMLAALAFTSTMQLDHWRSDIALWEHAIVVAPQSRNAHQSLGLTYMAAGGRYATLALHEFQRAVEIEPTNLQCLDLLAGSLMGHGRVDESAAVMATTIRLQRKLDRENTAPVLEVRQRQQACMSVGKLLLARHKPAEAAEMFQFALEFQPTDKDALAQLELARRQLQNPATTSLHEPH